MQDEVVLPIGRFEDQVLLQSVRVRASEFQRVQAKPPCEPLSFLGNQRGQLQTVATTLVQSFPTVPQHSESHLSPLHPKAFSALYFSLITWCVLTRKEIFSPLSLTSLAAATLNFHFERAS